MLCALSQTKIGQAVEVEERYHPVIRTEILHGELLANWLYGDGGMRAHSELILARTGLLGRMLMLSDEC